MKKLLLASVALVAFATAASAADLPQRQVAPAPYVPVVPAFTWTGFYAGLNGGYAFSNSDNVPWSLNGVGQPAYKLSRDGFTGGAQVGYNMQFNSLVAGLETDINYTDLSKRGFDAFGDTARSRMTYFGTVRGRLGFVPMDRAMIYVTGGLAYGDTKLSAAVAGTTLAGSKTDTNVGWTLGGGVEYALTNNITTKIEYLYYDLGDTKLNLSNGVNTASYKANNNGSIIRAGLNYKF